MTTELDLFHLHQSQRAAAMAYRYGSRPSANEPEPKEPAHVYDPRRLLANSAEREALCVLTLAGLEVEPTHRHGARFDLLVNGRLRIEVKASTWRAARGRRGRYQAHWHNRADMLLWLLANVGQWLVIPASELGNRRNLAIWSYDARDYAGQWAAYLDAWHILDTALETAKGGIFQERLL